MNNIIHHILKYAPKGATGLYAGGFISYGYRTNRDKAPDNYFFFDDIPSNSSKVEEETQPEIELRTELWPRYPYEVVQNLQRKLKATRESLSYHRKNRQDLVELLNLEDEKHPTVYIKVMELQQELRELQKLKDAQNEYDKIVAEFEHFCQLMKNVDLNTKTLTGAFCETCTTDVSKDSVVEVNMCDDCYQAYVPDTTQQD